MAGSGTLITTIEADLRKKVNDESSRRFSRADLMRGLSLARRHVSMVFGRLVEPGYFEKETSEQLLSGNAPSFFMPADFIGVKTLALVVNPIALGGAGDDRIAMDPLPRHLTDRARNRLPVAVSGTKPFYWIRRSADRAAQPCFILPSSAQARYFVLLYQHDYADLGDAPAAGDKIDTPLEFDELVVLYAAIVLSENDRKMVGPFKEEYQALESARVSVLQGSQDETGTEQVSSDWHDEFNDGTGTR